MKRLNRLKSPANHEVFLSEVCLKLTMVESWNQAQQNMTALVPFQLHPSKRSMSAQGSVFKPRRRRCRVAGQSDVTGIWEQDGLAMQGN